MTMVFWESWKHSMNIGAPKRNFELSLWSAENTISVCHGVLEASKAFYSDFTKNAINAIFERNSSLVCASYRHDVFGELKVCYEHWGPQAKSRNNVFKLRKYHKCAPRRFTGFYVYYSIWLASKLPNPLWMPLEGTKNAITSLQCTFTSFGDMQTFKVCVIFFMKCTFQKNCRQCFIVSTYSGKHGVFIPYGVLRNEFRRKRHSLRKTPLCCLKTP